MTILLQLLINIMFKGIYCGLRKKSLEISAKVRKCFNPKWLTGKMFMSTSMCYWKSHRKKGKGEKEEDKYRWQDKKQGVLSLRGSWELAMASCSFFFSPQLVTRRPHSLDNPSVSTSVFILTSQREWVCAWSLTYQASENLHYLGMYFLVALFELRCNCDSPHRGGEDEDKSLVEQTRKQKTPQAFRERDFFKN